jgi:hypothetical protein
MAAIDKSITVALLTLGLLALGCSDASKKWYGRWEGEADRVDPSMPQDDVRRSVNRIQIDIKPDGTFEMIDGPITKSGKHTLGGDKAFLTATKLVGKPIEPGSGTDRENQDMVMEWQEDGSVLWHDPRGFDEAPVRLTLKSKPGT